jgi:flagellar biogenesis protein FliO
MKILAMLTVLLTAGAVRAETLRYHEGAVQLPGGAKGKARSVWARGKTLVVVLPPGLYKTQSLRVGQDGLKSVRVVARRKRTDVELRLDKRADRMLGKIELRERGQDLLVVVDRAAFAAAAKRAAEQAAALKLAQAAKAKAAAEAKAQAAQAAKAKSASKPAASEQQDPKSAKPGWMAKKERAKQSKAGGWLGKKGNNKQSDNKMWVLFGLLLCGGGAAWYMRKRGKKGGGPRAEIDVVCSRSVGGKQRLMLVSVQGQKLLIGATDKELRMLHALDSTSAAPAPEFVDASGEGAAAFEHLLAPQHAEPPRDRFMERLEQQMSRTSAAPSEEAPLDEAWAQGIRRLRRARAAQQGGQQQGFSQIVS